MNMIWRVEWYMPVFAFVVYKSESEKIKFGTIAKAGFFKSRAGTVIFRILNKSEFKNPVCSLCTVSGCEIVLVRLPFTASMLNLFDLSYIEELLTKLCSKNGCTKCFVPDELIKSGEFVQFKTDPDIKMMIFRSLQVPIIEAIFSQNGVKPDLLDITFISGENTSELLYLIKQLEPYIKFVNVAADDKEAVGNMLEDFCAESGLSIYIGSEFRSLLRNSDLIINLNCTLDLSNYRIKPECILLNFSNTDSRKLQGNFTVINGLNFRFADNQYEQLGSDVQRCFSNAVLSEYLMGIIAGLMGPENYKEDPGNETYSNETIMNSILNIFRLYNCKVTGLIGRRGVLGTGEVFRTIKNGLDKRHEQSSK